MSPTPIVEAMVTRLINLPFDDGGLDAASAFKNAARFFAKK